MFASVSLNIGIFPPRNFEYAVPEELKEKIQRGSLVWVPFRNRKRWGIVEDISPNPTFHGHHAPIGQIIELPQSMLADQLPVISWLSEYYLCSLALAAQTAIPLKFFMGRDFPSQAALITAEGGASPALNATQQEAFLKMVQNWQQERKPTYLLGPTGSGKTYVLLAFILELLKENRSAMYLVPEITLTPQFIETFTKELPRGTPIAIWTSKTSLPLKKKIYEEILSGKLRFVIGTRSAVFLPLPNLGTIILDEEQDGSFKQETPAPCYHAREVALWRAKTQNAMAIFASATPSLECYREIQENRILKIELSERYLSKSLPKITITEQGSRKKETIPLLEIIREKVTQGEQVLVFHNRRGYVRSLKCESCKLPLLCQYCELPLTLHKNGTDQLRCHHCGVHKKVPTACPACNQNTLTFYGLGLGTQKIEQEIRNALNVKVLRLDKETSKDAHQILSEFKKGDTPVLVGTKLITKGLHYPQVSFVAVLNADTELTMPDFRACERTFQSLLQVAGRTGRGERPGEALLCTANPKHYVFESLRSGNWEGFYSRELEIRRELNLPPFSRLLVLELKSKVKQKVMEAADLLSGELTGNEQFEMVGSAPSYFARIRNHWRYQVLMKHDPAKKISKEAFFKTLEGFSKKRSLSGLKILIHPDPQNLF